MASKDNQQQSDEGNRINHSEATISKQDTKKIQNIPTLQHQQKERGTSSSSQSKNKKAQSKSSKLPKPSKSSDTRSNNSNKKNKLSAAKINSSKLASGRKSIFSSKVMEEIQNTPMSEKVQQKNNDTLSAPKKRSKMKKVLNKFKDIIKGPTKTIKSSLGMNNQKKMSHVDRLRNQKNSDQSKKLTRDR